jgi:hypothetical protein
MTVRVIAGGTGVVCAAAEAPSAIAPSESDNASDGVPVVLNRMMASQFNRWLKHHTRFFRLL